MTEKPADIPADGALQAIYASVGNAMSRWETLEAHLSFTYSIFKRKPLDRATMKNYGREERVLTDRLTAVRKSADEYFRSRPNQEQEGRVDCFLREAQRLARFRHRIAHGVVVSLESGRGNFDHKVKPPTHAVFHLTKDIDGEDYGYGAFDIDAYAAEFADLARSVQLFNHELYPPRGAHGLRAQDLARD